MRKTVTVVFADLVGSTAMGERLDPEAMGAVMERYFAHMQQIIERHGGRVEKFIGDAVVAFFGIPLVHEDDALRAVRAAAGMRDALQELNTELEPSWGVELAIRIGINTGEVVTDESTLGGSIAVGDAVNVAARLEQAAEPGEILLGRETYRQAKDAIDVEFVEDLALKGKQKPVAVWRLLEVIEGAAPMSRRFDSPLVGRRDELSHMRRLFDEAVDERAVRLCTVLGSPGVGKTRLATEFARSVGPQAQALSGRCPAYGEGTAFRPLVEMLGELPESLGVEEVYVWARERFETLSREQPLVLFFDDLQWAEPTLLDLIEHVTTWAQDAPLFCLCLARPEFQPPWEGERLRLQPLEPDEARDLLVALAGDLPRGRQARILDRAEGNPLFLEQMPAMLEEQGDVDVPPTIQILLSARLDRLPAEHRRTAQRAAVVGRELSRDALVALSPPGIEVSAAVQRLIRKDFLETTRAGGGARLRFRHALVRDAAYASLAKQERAILHRRLARWLKDEGESNEVLGYHFEQAFRYRSEIGPVGDDERELACEGGRYLGLAGGGALDRGDVQLAVGLFERSFALEPVGVSDPDRLVTSFAAGLVARGHFGRAQELLQSVVDKTSDPHLELHARLELAVLRSHIVPVTDMEEVRRLAEEAISVFEAAGDHLGLASAWAVLGEVHHNAVRVESRHEAFQRSLHYAQRVGNRRLEREAVMRITSGLDWGPIPVPEAIRQCNGILGEQEGNLQIEASCKLVLGVLTSMLEEFQEARVLVTRAKQMWIELGDSIGVIRASEARRLVEMHAGDPAGAEKQARASLDALERMGEKNWLSSAPDFSRRRWRRRSASTRPSTTCDSAAKTPPRTTSKLRRCGGKFSPELRPRAASSMQPSVWPPRRLPGPS